MKLATRRIPALATCLMAASALVSACRGSDGPERSASGEEALTIGGGIDRGGIGGIGRDAGVLPSEPLTDHEFYVRSLGSRCFDLGGRESWTVGTTVTLATCSGSVSQHVRVRELAPWHDVELRTPAPSSLCFGVRGGHVVVGQPLELQTCDGSAAQRFALDGDSVMVGDFVDGRVNRDYVIESENDATASGTPLVVGVRDTSDAEYFRMATVDGAAVFPTSGFVRVGAAAPPAKSDQYLRLATQLGWGTVIEIDDAQTLLLTETQSIPAGVTLRGYRKHRNEGAAITFRGTAVPCPDLPPRPHDSRPHPHHCPPPAEGAAIWVTGDRARVTGLRFLGPGTDTTGFGAIKVLGEGGRRILVDHIEATGWSASAVDVDGGDPSHSEHCPLHPPFPRTPNAQVLRSYIHDNKVAGGYGVSAGSGAFIVAQGNVEYLNAHSVTSDPWRLSGYAAYDNLLLSPWFDKPRTSNQDFDVHGSGDSGPGGSFSGGIAGDYFDIGWNTFLGTHHYNLNQRGTPCRFMLFHDNIARNEPIHVALSQSTGPRFSSAPAALPPPPHTDYFWQNQVGSDHPHPLAELAVGDFDGDHVDDVFVGTGTTWWFSSGGTTEWRFLNRKNEHASRLRFGDFDGDGRTDVLTVDAEGSIVVSWAGISEWQAINAVAWKLEDLAVGDFDGDHVSDLFLATGSDWFVAPGGRVWQPFVPGMSYRTPDLRFGDFTGDGKTDVLGVNDNAWVIVEPGRTAWSALRSAPAPTLAGFVVADFDGDGFADVARHTNDPELGHIWQYAQRGVAGLIRMRSDSRDLAKLPIGRFDEGPGADVIDWTSDDTFAIAPGPTGALRPQSRHPMR